MMRWLAEDEELLRQLWNKEHRTASQCAAILGVTRNAVIGKVHRLNLEVRQSPKKPRLSDKQRAEHRLENQRRYRATHPEKPRVRPPKPPRPPKEKAPPVDAFKPAAEDLAVGVWNALPDTTPIGLLDLTATTCRWPIGDGSPFLFCGCQVAHGSSYCPTHKHIGAGKGTIGEQNAVNAAQSAAKQDRNHKRWLEAA